MTRFFLFLFFLKKEKEKEKIANDKNKYIKAKIEKRIE